MSALPPAPWNPSTGAVPAVGFTAQFLVVTEPPTPFLTLHPASSVNGRAVTLAAAASSGRYNVSYVTPAVDADTGADGRLWPWTGLRVALALVQGAGVSASSSPWLNTTVVAGAVLTEASSPLGLTALPAQADGLCVGDVNGDLADDVVVVAPGALQLWVNPGDTGGPFVNAATAFGMPAPASLPHAATGCAFIDANDDGWVDLLLVAATAANGTRLLINANGSALVDSTSAWLPPSVHGPEGPLPCVFVADVSKDGHPDIVICTGDDNAADVVLLHRGSMFEPVQLPPGAAAGGLPSATGAGPGRHRRGAVRVAGGRGVRRDTPPVHVHPSWRQCVLF